MSSLHTRPTYRLSLFHPSPAINAFVYSSTVSRTVVQASSEPSVASVSLVASVNANHGAVLTKADLAIAICIILSDDVGQLLVRDEDACVNPQRCGSPVSVLKSA